MKAGILYNGFEEELSLDATDGRYECVLTRDYSVWINKADAASAEPAWTEDMDPDQWSAAYDEWDRNRPCDIFLAEIIEDSTPVYTSPKHGHATVRHAQGTLVRVCGEFGSDYYVDAWTDGFVPKDAVRKISDLNITQRYAPYIYDSLPVQTLYASATEPVYFSTAAGGYSEDATFYGYTENREVKVMRELGDWVQLDGGGFVEKRFLDPDASHSYPTAWVKCDGVLDRLNVRSHADTDATSEVKLCSGIPVHVISQTEKWAVIFFTGPNGGYRYTGCVMKEYLSFDGKDIPRDGATSVRLVQDLNGDRDGICFSDKGQGEVLSAGTLLTVVGVYPAWHSSPDEAEMFLCETEDGRYIQIRKSGVLEPVETETGIFAAARSAVRMRTAPSQDAEVIRQVKAKTKVEVLLRGEIWTIVKYKGETGYMMSRYLSFP